MIIIIWEFKVKLEKIVIFEEFYAAKGKWAKLFAQSKDFGGIELLKNRETETYLTIDRWASLEAFDTFKFKFKKEYQELDEICEDFTISEKKLGVFNSV
jgi:hypothetical protein